MKSDLSAAQAKAQSLETEYRRIVEMRAQGKTYPEIGKALGLHRSAVWRRVRKIKALGLHV